MKKLLVSFSVSLMLFAAPGYAELMHGKFSGIIFYSQSENPYLPAPPLKGSILTGEFMYETEDAISSNNGYHRIFSKPSCFFIKAGDWTFHTDLTAAEPSTNEPAGLEIRVRNDEDLGGSNTYDVFEVQGFGTSTTFPFIVNNINEVFFTIGDPTGELIKDTNIPIALNLSGMPFPNFYAMVDLIDNDHNEWSFISILDTFEFAPVPTITAAQPYLSDYLTLGGTFSFDYWWKMGMEPTEGMLDILFFNGTEWESFEWELNLYNSSDEWQTASFVVPPFLRGETVQIMFAVLVSNPETNSTVYLRNISSTPMPVPEPAIIKINPDTLNIKSKGKYITCYIEIPDVYSVENIDIEKVLLIVNGSSIAAELTPTEIEDYNNNGTRDLMVKFDRQSVQDACTVGNTEMTLNFQTYDGTDFEGNDVVLIIDKGKEHSNENHGSVVY
jgi:hypothetical protein